VRCDVCNLPDLHNGQGDGVGSCDCPRCDCGAASWSSLCTCPSDDDYPWGEDPDAGYGDDDVEWPDDVWARPIVSIEPVGGVL
jgi:hypothetical protein